MNLLFVVDKQLSMQCGMSRELVLADETFNTDTFVLSVEIWMLLGGIHNSVIGKKCFIEIYHGWLKFYRDTSCVVEVYV